MNILFVCNQGQNRSKTAEFLFRDFNTKSAGLYNNLLTKEQLEWANIMFVMEEFTSLFGNYIEGYELLRIRKEHVLNILK